MFNYKNKEKPSLNPLVACLILGKVSYGETYVIAFFFFLFQSFISYLWLKRKDQGPIEFW
ncbi:MAG: putative membrane protein YeiB [Flavobacteriaceae bacterium]|jgi:uncharacterized membrane protein YeiB